MGGKGEETSETMCSYGKRARDKERERKSGVRTGVVRHHGHVRKDRKCLKGPCKP